MPFINVQVTVPLTEEKKDVLKAAFGQAISVMGKPESYVMFGIQDNYTLYFGGKKLDKGAFVGIDVLGSVNAGQSQQMSAKVCDILKKELDIPGDKVYIRYQGYDNWGWNGSNF